MAPLALVLDMMPRRDSPFEGEIVSSFLENMGWNVRRVFKPKVGKVPKELFKAFDCDLIHLSAHATKDSIDAGQQGRGYLDVDEIFEYFDRKLDQDEIRLDETSIVVNSGCETFSPKWCQLFVDSFRVKNYIAPIGKPSIDEGILFPLHIYTNLYGQRERFRAKNALEKAQREMKLEVRWDIRTYR